MLHDFQIIVQCRFDHVLLLEVSIAVFHSSPLAKLDLQNTRTQMIC